MLSDDRPIFIQLAEWLEGGIARGDFPEGSPIPSINELAAFHRINPATANKAVAQLTAKGLITRQRGVGMFVNQGARAALVHEKTQDFAEERIAPLVSEAKLIGLSLDELTALTEKEWNA
ncbi:GntR family transcriptional regulator [Rarobacter faecitabidus]|uniref:DNA-binding transcriptional regulator YhcF (GntR family) n=1 Tax=Rarobacter faecitabidus TaxID=13243 RepID=A0A542ZB05_RARFA|nr:GntR family transcriptional regulator [Rarobacter faecitabidus]TQL57492.1 DNA-binding transcriptional regulator YhcF (GntR family) [Rarobacter faecitabidus]